MCDDDRALPGRIEFLDRFGDAEIEEHRLAIADPEADVFGLEVAMYEVRRMHRRQRFEQGNRKLVDLVLGGRPAEFREPVFQIDAFDIFQHDVGRIIGVERAENLDDVAVLELGEVAALDIEPLKPFLERVLAGFRQMGEP